MLLCPGDVGQPVDPEGSGRGGRSGPGTSPYRAVLALDAGAVETQGRAPVDGPLDVEDALVASLARLRLRQVSSLEGDGLHFPHWYQDLVRGYQLGTVLGNKQRASVCAGSHPPTPRAWAGHRPSCTPPIRLHLFPGCGVHRENEISQLLGLTLSSPSHKGSCGWCTGDNLGINLQAPVWQAVTGDETGSTHPCPPPGGVHSPPAAPQVLAAPGQPVIGRSGFPARLSGAFPGGGSSPPATL